MHYHCFDLLLECVDESVDRFVSVTSREHFTQRRVELHNQQHSPVVAVWRR
jgi:hypothetical protein